MIDTLIALGIGFIAGAFFGVFLVALLTAAKED